MSVLQITNLLITASYYLCCIFFLAAFVQVFLKTKRIQDALLYGVIMIPFVLRILRLK